MRSADIMGVIPYWVFHRPRHDWWCGDFGAFTPSLEATMGTIGGLRKQSPFDCEMNAIQLSPLPKTNPPPAPLVSGEMSSFTKRGSADLEATLRRMVVVFRFLGLIWMLILVAVTVLA